MFLVSCTQKYIGEILPSKAAMLSKLAIENIAPLKHWHANCFKINKTNNIIFTYHDSLYSVVITGISKKQYASIPEIFLHKLVFVMHEDGFPQEIINILVSDNEFVWRKNSVEDRKILGSMNNMISMLAFEYKTDELENSKFINHTPFGALKYTYPVEMLKKDIWFKDV